MSASPASALKSQRSSRSRAEADGLAGSARCAMRRRKGMSPVVTSRVDRPPEPPIGHFSVVYKRKGRTHHAVRERLSPATQALRSVGLGEPVPMPARNRIVQRSQMKPAILVGQPTRQAILGAALVYFSAVSFGAAQTPALLDVPKELFASFCYFGSGVYSPGATFCTKTGTSIVCRGPNKDNNFALWVPMNPDEGCQSSPPPPPK